MAFNIGGTIAPLAGAIFGGFDERSQDDRQIRQQKRLTEIQEAANARAAQNSQALQLDLWNKTNYGAQKEHMIEAGLNPALMYGMKGGGGATTGGAQQAGVSGGQAANAAATTQNKLAMGMQIAQSALLAAQTEKTKAETKNLEAGTTKTGVETETGKLDLDTKQKTQEATIRTIEENAAKALADAVQSQQRQVINEETMRDQIRSIQEEAIGKILQNEGVTIENRRKEANLAVEKFEAKMAESGISPRTPWYMKLVVDLLDKIGMNPLKGGQ